MRKRLTTAAVLFLVVVQALVLGLELGFFDGH
jgi:hypothetical protein